MVDDVEELLERLHDEDQRNEQREALLREARDVAHLSTVDCGHVYVSEINELTSNRVVEKYMYTTRRQI